MFAGSVAESTTLEGMLKGLSAPAGALVIMDRGIATEKNIDWMKEHGYYCSGVSVCADTQKKAEEQREQTGLVITKSYPLGTAASNSNLHAERRTYP